MVGRLGAKAVAGSPVAIGADLGTPEATLVPVGENSAAAGFKDTLLRCP